MDRLVVFFTGRSAWKCRRCGWRGRRAWHDGDIAVLPQHGGEDSATGDPELRALDDSLANGLGGLKSAPTYGPNAASSAPTPDRDDVQLEDTPIKGPPSHETASEAAPHSQRRARSRRKGLRRRQIFGVMAGTTAVAGLIMLLGVIPSCGSDGDAGFATERER